MHASLRIHGQRVLAQRRQRFSQVVGIGTPPTPHPQASVPPLPGSGGGAHSLARDGLGESQFRRGDVHCGSLSLYIGTYFVSLRPGRKRKGISVSSEQQLKKKNYSRWDSYLYRRDLELMKDVNNGPGLDFV